MKFNTKLITIAMILLPFMTVISAPIKNYEINSILQMTINSSINPATLNYLSSGYKQAKVDGANLVLIKMNTPGGLVSTTKSILTLFGSSDMPTVVWVTPEGASATSAGAIIASGAHLLFMSEGTNIGAATPIELSGDIKQVDMKNKAINDLVALVQSLSEARGRNGALFGQMVEKASSFKAKEAKKKNLIDGIVDNKADLLDKINNKKVTVKGTTLKLILKSKQIIEFSMDLGQRLLNIFANPSMAYVLLLIGAALIYLELQAPGGFIAGSIGTICLILAGIGFQVLPLNFGAFGLIILSFVMFILEIYITSFGIISLAGIAALIFGSLFLFRTDNAYISLSNSVIFSSVSAIALFLAFVTFFLVRNIMNKKHVQFFSLVGKQGIVVCEVDSHQAGLYRYQVKISGEIWNARSTNKYSVDDMVTVKEHDVKDLMLIV
ncbi:MAG: nodulation protein NfeD [Bacteriovoracaceae bacterium]|nr:nodulation protein NfeD [Bacteriovoracaceae bacterium]